MVGWQIGWVFELLCLYGFVIFQPKIFIYGTVIAQRNLPLCIAGFKKAGRVTVVLTILRGSCMKPVFNRIVCVLLVCSFVFSFLPVASAGHYSHNDLVNAIYSDLNSACNIVASGRGYTETQNARPYLSHAQRLLKRHGGCNCFDSRLDRVIDNAKMEILWNNRHEALDRINIAIRMVENTCHRNCSANRGWSSRHNHTGSAIRRSATAGAIIATPVAVGLGAVLVRFFRGFNWGQVSGTPTRVPRPNLPGSIINVR